MSKKIRISKKALLAANKKHDAGISKIDLEYKHTNNSVYSTIYKGREGASVGKAWSKRLQGKPYNIPKDSL
jgi:hypothetical protein